MKDPVDIALNLFENSHNCSQSVLGAFSDHFGMTQHQALSVASGFGAGICFQGKTCGAVTGAYMLLGLYSGSKFTDGESIKENTYQLINAFNKEFKSQYQSTNCSTLLDVDISNQIGLDKAIELGVFKTKCPELVKSAVTICKKLIKTND